jgi:hypothetical protein
MHKIQDAFKMEDSTVIFCTYSDNEFDKATSVILCSGDNRFTAKRFSVGKMTQCFSDKPTGPAVKIDETVPERYLQAGNLVEFAKNL